MKVLFVCTGNTCRSPMAEAYLRQKLENSEIISAGISAIAGQSASGNSIKALEKEGITLGNHTSQRVTNNLLKDCNLILTMTLDHKLRLVHTYPEYEHKIFTLKEYAQGVESFEILDSISLIEKETLNKRDKLLKEELSDHEVKEKLTKLLSGEIQQLEYLYQKLSNLDVADPFGGTIEQYVYTLQEIKENIDLALCKIKGLEP